MQKIAALLTAFLTITISAISQTKPATAAKSKPATNKVYTHELMGGYASVLGQNEILALKKSLCTKYDSELLQYLGVGASQNYKIRISYVNAGGLLKGYSFFNEVYEAGKSVGANVLLAITPGSPDALIKIKVEGDNITQLETTNIKTGEKTLTKLSEPKYNMNDLIYKQLQLFSNKNVLSGTEKATQTGFASRPSMDPLEDNLKKKHGVLFISDFYEFQTPGGTTGLIYKHYTEKGNYSTYTHYVTDMKGNTLIQPVVAPTMPKYDQVYDLTYTTISDGKTHTLKVPYGASYYGLIIKQLIEEGYLK